VVLTEGAAPVFSAIGQASDRDALRSFDLDRGRYVLDVGGLSPHKRVPALIDAFAQVCGASRVRTLVLAGPTTGDPFHTEAGSVAAAIGRAARKGAAVVQTGFVPDEVLAALYRHARCLVLPSMEEGFGLPAVEAMACGCAVLASHAPALVEVCGDAAEYVDRIEELPASLGRLLDDDGRRDEKVRLGLERSLQFRWPVAARRLLTALESAT
jgi:glycosyltransferase involved in cell wall biosynthesis